MARISVLLSIFFVSCVLVASALRRDVATSFFEAFPHSNPDEFYHLPSEVFEPQEPALRAEPFEWACPAVPVPPDTDNVNKLKPGHIKVVMSMGDSITAAMSAKDNIIINLKEYRGISYAIGGDKDVTTLPNILKQYTPTGYPLGVSTGIGKRTIATNGFNAAVSGAINVDMLGQAQWLVEQLKANSHVNHAKDWKHLTLWIGSNNLCDVCNNNNVNNAKDYEKNVGAALDYLYAHVPRLFVSLVANLDVTKLYDYNGGACGTLHPMECSCAANRNSVVRDGVRSIVKEYQTTSYKVAANFTSRNNPEFAVVVQPCLIDSYIFNRTYLSPADCFHPSAIAHRAISIALWNNLITPAAKKKTQWIEGEEPLCADANTILYTN